MAEAGTAGEVGAAASAEAKRITGRDVTFDLEGSDVQLAREHSEGVLRGLEAFPGTPLKEVRMADLREGVLAQCGDLRGSVGWERIEFSRGAQRDGPQAYRDELARRATLGRVGRHAVPDQPMGVALHEFGHSVSNHGGANAGAAQRARKFKDAHSDPHAEPEGRRAQGRIALGREISRYALESDGELAAEAFADVMLHGDQASGLSQDIFAHIADRAAG